MRRLEAQRSGNPLVSTTLDWVDYEAMGIAGPDEVDKALLDVLDVVGSLGEVYRLGVLGRFEDGAPPEVLEKFVEARHEIRERLAKNNMSNLVEPFDPARYNTGRARRREHPVRRGRGTASGPRASRPIPSCIRSSRPKP